ncbi:DNA polymerase III subunit delta' [uncultured Nocardioides sp.]|uniref:DNA polymerase III subunit delta' n=1 Tax=uncultured Nocardioides sp. TaxID=198441 RepID=UPI0026281830|nr:DNA polymerase III subunit delta' [uncultured Nocardioides sp.]
MSVWDRLVGQRAVVETLRPVVAGRQMTHAWLFTGPPGSGRSVAAVAFAAALQCERDQDGRDGERGCGECRACRTVLAGSHPDVTRVRTAKLSIGVDEIRELVRRAALTPTGRGWQVIVVEDADRLTERAVNALLKAIEEPGAKTVWLLCTPTVEDVLPTIRSRCRLVTLTTPGPDAVAEHLTATEGVDAALASYAARASQGHIGRAKALVRDAETRARRDQVVAIPGQLTGLGACLAMATRLAESAKAEAEAITGEVDARERADLDTSYGVVERGRRPREYAPAVAALEKDQRTRAKRQYLDVVDRGLMDIVSVYRDALAVALGSPAALVNEERREEIERLAASAPPQVQLRRIDAVLGAREQMLEFNVGVQLALEALMVRLWVPVPG